VADGRAPRKRRPDVPDQRRVVHLKAAGLEAKCGASDAADLTNWVRGATYDEIYVPADVLERADLVCGRCQEAALEDDGGSDDDVVSDDDGPGDKATDAAADDPAFAEVTDERLIREIARRLRERPLAEEEDDQADQHRD
jgi:hypothetical protein